MENTQEVVTFFWIGTFAMISIAFALIFLALFYQNSISKQKKLEAEMLLKVSLESEKSERTRIAADLHDSVSSDLSAIRNYLIIILKDELDSNKVTILQDLKDGVETAIENTRLVSYKLMPPLLDKLGFAVALDDYLIKLSKKTQLDFRMSVYDDKFDLNPAASYELFRVIQEFTTNMLKYGNITSCNIALSVLNSTANIEIVDDGIKYDFEKELLLSKGTGIKNISSRLKMINAKIIQKEVESGNNFMISFPLSTIK